MGTLDACNGHPLRVERARHNLTQQQLAEAARVGAMTVWRAENGYLINAESRQRLCDYFGKSASELGLLGRGEFISRKVPVPPQTTSLASVSPSVPAVRHSYEARPTSFSPAKALDLLLEAPNQVIGEHMGAWLALGASHLSVPFEAGWTLENILESLRVVMQGMQGLPAVTRRQLLNSRQDIESVRLRARLLAFSGEQAARLQRKEEAEDKLRASEDLLSYLPDPHEEFDRTGWLRQAGICALYSDQYSIAEKQLRTALREILEQCFSGLWLQLLQI